MKTNPVCFIKEYLTAFQFTMKDGTVHIGYGLSSVDAFLTVELPESERPNIADWTQLEGVEIPDEACLPPTVTIVGDTDPDDMEIDLSDLEDDGEDTEEEAEEEIEIEMDCT
jgi:hypothetical protein